ncbi:OmpA family protein [Stigmatella sp. ncwal1]|uniref:OmpA family protein n=1 Tax=Stigmatella ashevillensis TaxID=2995309 RepID=A0ABT5D5K3_9BACT|nr:OmpA family protein [Stigmatella ashevillena]MDC0708945.1 OmpA family protein [Stigmatella ashevillena]
MTVRLFVLCLGLSAVPAVAGEAIRVSLEGRAVVGQSTPALKVHILEPIAGFQVSLKRSDGKTVEASGSGKPGTVRTVPLEQPERRFHYEGTLTLRFADASEPGTMSLSFDAELLGPPTLTVSKEGLDLAARTLRFTLSRPAGRAKLTVLMDSGKKAFDGEVPFQGEAAGTPLSVTWPEAEGRVMRLSLQAYDTSDFYSSVELFPWQVDIPHEEVNFASGSAELAVGERGKLDHSHARIAEAVSRYGRFAALRLYVLGHTDSVGATAANRELSLQRARSIAAYFHKRGLRLPIFYEGFGEQALAVMTPDETAEVGNRRAEYILAVDEPVLPQSPFTPQWRKL